MTGKKTPRKTTQAAAKRTGKTAASRASVAKPAAPPRVVPPALPRLRLRLTNVDDVKRELARLYRETRAKRVDTQDASRMANMLSILGRLIESADFEARLEALERTTQSQRNEEGGRWPTRH